MKILILASNPRKDLNLDREIRSVKRVIESSGNQENFEVVDELAVRVGDLQQLLLKHQPQIVHFCGHGVGEQGLVFANDEEREYLVSTDALSNLFGLFSSTIECVLLNACYSQEQADAIVDRINYVIGMNQAIRDDAAIAFSKGFYRALAYACSIEQSYEFGCNAIQLEISGSKVVRSTVSEAERKLEVANAVAKSPIPEHQKPILKKKPTLTPISASIISPNQRLSQEKRDGILLDIYNFLKTDTEVNMNKPQTSGDHITAKIIGDISGQAAIGKEISQTKTVSATPQLEFTEADKAILLQMFNTLKAQVEKEAPPEKKASALERVEELKEAVTAKEPDLSTMEYVKNWFTKNLPTLAGSVTSIVVNPLVGKLVGVAGDALASDFRRRFGVK